MYNVVTRYITGDGVEHKTVDKAREHVATKIKIKIKDMLHNAVTEQCDGALSMNDIYSITELLYAKREQLHQVFNMELYGDYYGSEEV